MKVEILKVKKIAHGVIELRSDNILAFRPDIVNFKEYNIEILEELLEEFTLITDGIPRPYLVDNRFITGIVTKEEQAFINTHFGKFATKAGMITNSSVIRVLVNGYNSIFKPKVKIKLFSNEEDAVDWLLAN